MKLLLRFLALALLFSPALHAVAQEESLDVIQDRMADRVEAIETLKSYKVLGISYDGFLQPLKAMTPEQRDLVLAENEDRKMVYEAIAKEVGSTAKKVGQRRAQQLYKKAEPGTWLQDSKGEWYQKGSGQ